MATGALVRRHRVRMEWKVEDLWVGAYWDRRRWWGGTMEALDAATDEKRDFSLQHRRFDLWVCLIPMVPIHFTSLWCPQPRECSSDQCWIREVGEIEVRVAVDLGDPECTNCHGREWVHNLAMGPPHLGECSWCSIPCPSCQPPPEGRCARCGHKVEHHWKDLTACVVRDCPCGGWLENRVGVPESGDVR